MFKIFCLVWGVVFFGIMSFIFWVSLISQFLKGAEEDFGYVFMLSFIFPIPLVYCICELITIFRGIR
jgi:hypothetical protein